MNQRAKDLIALHDQMVSYRMNYEAIWKRIADVLRPLRNNISTKNIVPGGRKHNQIYHSGPISSLRALKAGLYGYLTSPSIEWFNLRVSGDDDLNNQPAVKEWLEQYTSAMQLSFTSSMSNFYNEAAIVYADLGAFGTGCMISLQRGPGRFHDACISLEQIYISANQWGDVDTLSREFRMTAKAAVQKYGDGVSPQIQRAASNDSMSLTEFTFIHMVKPNDAYVEGAIGPRGFAFESVYIERDACRIVLDEGFREFPYMVPRWEVAANEIYGRGQGEIALADILTLNEIRRTNLTMANRQSNPALLAVDELALSRTANGVAASPGSIIFGGMSGDGKRLVSPLDEGRNLALSVEYENLINDAVKDAFDFSLMQIQGSRDMTATEFVGRQEEMMRNMGPHIGRIENEFLTPLISRRFRMIGEMFDMPPPPPELDGEPLEVQFVSPLQQLQKSAKANRAMRGLEALMAGAQLDPSVANRFDANAYAEAVDKGFGSGIIVSREESEEAAERRQAMQQTMMLMENAQGLSSAAKNMSEVARG